MTAALLITLVSTFIITLLLSSSSLALAEDIIEFKRQYYNSGSRLYGRLKSDEPSASTRAFVQICWSSSLSSTDAAAICSMMGYTSDSASFSYTTSYFLNQGIGGLNCNTQSGNGTNFAQCTFRNVYTPCDYGSSSYRMMNLYCGSMTTDGGSRGVYVGGEPELYMRRRWNNQLQVREIFTTTWKNVAAESLTSSISYNAISNMCYWTGDISSSGWKYLSYASPVLDASNGFGLKDTFCATESSSSSYSMSSCSYSTSSLSSISSSKAVALNCELMSSDKGVSIGSGYYLRMVTGFSSTLYRTVQIVDTNSGSSSSSSSSVPGQQICYTSASAIDSATRETLCRWAGYGQTSMAYVSSTTTSSSAGAIWRSIDCPAGASSISQCSVQRVTSPYECSRYVTLYCLQSSTAPVSPKSAPNDDGGGFPVAAIVVPVGLFVFFIGNWIYQKQRQNNKTSSTDYGNTSNNAQVMNLMTTTNTSSSSSINNTEYQKFDNSPTIMMGQFSTPSSSAGSQPNNHNNNNPLVGRGDFYAPPPPPPNGYSFMPGFSPPPGGY